MPREPRDRQSWLLATQSDFNRMIRVEAADDRGICTCVTCGKTRLWNDKMDAGHFLAGSRQSIRFEESCVHPQCHSCNTGSCSHVNPWAGGQKKETVTIAYTRYMLERYGQDEIDRLIRLRETSRTWSIDELRVMRAEYKRRTSIARKEKVL